MAKVLKKVGKKSRIKYASGKVYLPLERPKQPEIGDINLFLPDETTWQRDIHGKLYTTVTPYLCVGYKKDRPVWVRLYFALPEPYANGILPHVMTVWYENNAIHSQERLNLTMVLLRFGAHNPLLWQKGTPTLQVPQDVFAAQYSACHNDYV